MSAIFDTSFIEALHNRREQEHARAKQIMASAIKGEYGRLLLPEYVFDEAVTLAYSRTDKKSALELGERLLSSEFEFVPSDPQTFNQAWETFRKTEKLSFTDCVIIALSKSCGAAVVSFDREFKKIPSLKVIS